MDLRLVSTTICDDVLQNPAGRLTLHAIFRDLHADAYPAEVVRLHAVTTWFNGAQAAREVIERVAITAPDGELVADAATTFSVQAGAYHSQISRFRWLVLPTPGVYRVQVVAGAEVVADLPLLAAAPTVATTVATVVDAEAATGVVAGAIQENREGV